LYMEIPVGYEVNGNRTDYVLKVVNNLYGQKQAGRVWNQYLVNGFKKIGFVQSMNDLCVFWQGKTLIVVYTNVTIVTDPDEAEIDQTIKDIGDNFETTHQPALNDFLGVHIDRDESSGMVCLTQPQSIKSILKDLNLTETSNDCKLPALTTEILCKHEDSKPP
jgi:Reverse transcriptase (RNA-dependent DNA polymerase)